MIFSLIIQAVGDGTSYECSHIFVWLVFLCIPNHLSYIYIHLLGVGFRELEYVIRWVHLTNVNA
jgi:hypothetical protein